MQKSITESVKEQPRAWERAGLKNEHEYHELLNRLGYRETVLDDYVPGKGFHTATLLHIGNGIFVMAERLDADHSKSFAMPT